LNAELLLLEGRRCLRPANDHNQRQLSLAGHAVDAPASRGRKCEGRRPEPGSGRRSCNAARIDLGADPSRNPLVEPFARDLQAAADPRIAPPRELLGDRAVGVQRAFVGQDDSVGLGCKQAIAVEASRRARWHIAVCDCGGASTSECIVRRKCRDSQSSRDGEKNGRTLKTPEDRA